MKTLVAGASGATGKQLVEQLAKTGHQVKVLLRPTATIPDSWHRNRHIQMVWTSISRLGADEMAYYLSDCQAAASCLGHNPTLKGIYGSPRRLVTDTVRLFCDAISKNAPVKPVRLVLMNTAGNRNRDLDEPISAGERAVTALLRLFLPPHPDNENAADYLRIAIGKAHPYIEWAVVRPDSLIDLEHVTGYSLHASPIRSALFNPGKTSRINVAHFMAGLITNETTWNTWKGQMPVIYNDVE